MACGVFRQCHACLLLALTMWVVVVSSLRFPIGALQRRAIQPRMSYRATTYTSVKLPSHRKAELLVKSSHAEIVEAAQHYKSTGKTDEKEVQGWIDQGLAFWSDSSGLSSLASKEDEHRSERIGQLAPNVNSWQAVDSYVNCGTESCPVYMESHRYRKMVRNEAIPAGRPLHPEVLASLIDEGSATANITQLLLHERVRHRADAIAQRIKADYPMSSEEWNRWSNMTARYNSTSLTQAVSTYFSEYSVGDVGGEDVDYVPRAGYVGTLAPGEKFEDTNPIENLPKKVLHPWPAMQELQFHVRWPPSHPMIPPPLLWFALNNMYTESFAAAELSRPRPAPVDPAESLIHIDGAPAQREVIIGGSMMEPRDALRIARDAAFGRSYEPSEQIPHGGSVFDSGFKIPHYNPDHGPTVSEEEAALDIPKELLPITERWLDPYHGLDELMPAAQIEDSEVPDAQREEEQRRRAAERILHGHGTPSWELDAAQERESLQAEVERRLGAHKDVQARLRHDRVEQEQRELDAQLAERRSQNPEAGDMRGQTAQAESSGSSRGLMVNVNLNMAQVSIEEAPVEKVDDDATLREKFRKEIEAAKVVADAQQGRGRVRSRRALIQYTIQTSQDLIERIIAAEREAASVTKRPGRRRAKRRDGEDGDDTGVGEVMDGGETGDSEVLGPGLEDGARTGSALEDTAGAGMDDGAPF